MRRTSNEVEEILSRWAEEDKQLAIIERREAEEELRKARATRKRKAYIPVRLAYDSSSYTVSTGTSTWTPSYYVYGSKPR